MTEFNKLKTTKELLVANIFQNKEIFINHINTLNHYFNDLDKQICKIFYNKRNKRGLCSIVKSISENFDDSDNERYMKLFQEIKRTKIY